MSRPTESLSENTERHSMTPVITSSKSLYSMETAIYLRVSTDRQTLEQQQMHLDMFSKQYNLNLKDCQRFQDKDTSAMKDKFARLKDRPDGGKLWAGCLDGTFKRIVVLDLDRMWRQGLAGVTDAVLLMEMGVEIIACMTSGMAIDMKNSDGFIAFWNKMGAAQAECMRTSERNKRKVAQKMRVEGKHGMGEPTTGKVYGYDTCRYVENEAIGVRNHPQFEDCNCGYLRFNYEEQAVINEIVSRRKGRHAQGWSDIMHFLNENGISSATGGKWTVSSVKRCLQSKTHILNCSKLQNRYVNHSVLGRVKVGFGGSVLADGKKKALEAASQFIF